MEEKKWGTYKVSIDKIGRKWTQVTIHYQSLLHVYSQTDNE